MARAVAMPYSASTGMIMDPRRSDSTLVSPFMFVTSSGKAYAAETCPRRFGDAGGSGDRGVPLEGGVLSRGSHSFSARGEPTLPSMVGAKIKNEYF